MADNIISTGGNSCKLMSRVEDAYKNPARSKSRITFSTATLPGLLQAYSLAPEYFQLFLLKPEELKASLEDETRRNVSIFMLQKGAQAINCLDCLRDGDPKALEYLETLLSGMVYDFYSLAERGICEGKRVFGGTI